MYLAWLRTGLALAALGVAAERLLPAEGIIWARQLVRGIAHPRRRPNGGFGAVALADDRPCHTCGTSDPPADPRLRGGGHRRLGRPGHDRAAAARRRRVSEPPHCYEGAPKTPSVRPAGSLGARTTCGPPRAFRIATIRVVRLLAVDSGTRCRPRVGYGSPAPSEVAWYYSGTRCIGPHPCGRVPSSGRRCG